MTIPFKPALLEVFLGLFSKRQGVHPAPFVSASSGVRSPPPSAAARRGSWHHFRPERTMEPGKIDTQK